MLFKMFFPVFQYYGQYSKKGLAKVLESELHGNLEECLMTLGKETSAHFRLCVFMCGCLQEILDMLNAPVAKDYLGSLFFQLCMLWVDPDSSFTQNFITQR